MAMMMSSAADFFAAAVVLLLVLAISNFHHCLGDDDSLRGNTMKQRNQDPDQNLLGNLHPLQRMKRSWIIAVMELEEEDKGPFPKRVGELVNNKSSDMSLKYLIHGPGVDEYPYRLFSIEDDANGQVYVHRSVDREETPSFMIRCDVADRRTGEIVDKSLYFKVKVKDINDNAPEFHKKEFNITVKESHKRDEPVFNVTAFDKDEKGTANSQVVYSLVSQMPHPKEPVFTVDASRGLIYVSGCADYQKTPRTFQLLIKATDQGIPQLSSTATINIVMEDSNNHLPAFTKENHWLNIPEGETEHNILRFSVEDGDSPNTVAWRAKYKIETGNENKNFIVTTDPKSNEGVLSIVKPLAYNGTSERRLVISVENEEPLFSCVGGRVRTLPISPRKAFVNVKVIDRNDAPQFNPPLLFLPREEGLGPGTRLAQYTARDPDAAANIIRYKIASDPAGWLTVAENSGFVTTVKTLDRESPYVNNSMYITVIHAVDNGVPPLTGTGTIQLYLSDLNDNVPTLVPPYLDVCDGNGKRAFIIKAEDKDSFPYTKPFTFQLADSRDTSWKLGQTFDDSVELLMVKGLPLGYYLVPLHISDQQGFFKEQNLHVRVCSCLDGSTCVLPMKSASVALGGGAVAAILAAFLVLILGLCLLLWCSCSTDIKKHPAYIPYEEGNQTLIRYNEESQNVLQQDMPDLGNRITVKAVHAKSRTGKLQAVKLPLEDHGKCSLEQAPNYTSHDPPEEAAKLLPLSRWIKLVVRKQPWFTIVQDAQEMFQAKLPRNINCPNGKTMPPAILEAFKPTPGWDQRFLGLPNNEMRWKKQQDMFTEKVGEILNQKLYYISDIEDNKVSYPLHVYANEGHVERTESIWSLPMEADLEGDLPSDFLATLGPKFATLAEICKK